MLSHLCVEVEKHEPEALIFCTSWCIAAGVFYVVKMYVQPHEQAGLIKRKGDQRN